MKRIAWLHCFAGISGDMLLGALLDAGASIDGVRSAIATLPLDGFVIDESSVLRAGLSTRRVNIQVNDDHSSRKLRTIEELIGKSNLTDAVKDRSLSVFSKLASVEAGIHQSNPHDVHFHEVGGHDAIIDIVGCAIAIETLGIDEFASSPVALGQGMVKSQHGLLPNPAPATLQMLHGIPVVGKDVDVELTTPTGAALLSTLVSNFGPMPPMTPIAIGYGAGFAEIRGLPNCLQIVIGDCNEFDRANNRGGGQALSILETNIDDVTGEQLGFAIAELMTAGALDAWITPVWMKKGRPGHTLHVLCDQAKDEELSTLVFRVTGTFGIRTHLVNRLALERSFDAVVVTGQEIAIKMSAYRAKPEYSDLELLARKTGKSLRELQHQAIQESLEKRSSDPDGS